MAIAIDTTTNLVFDSSADSGETLSHDGGTGSDRVTVGFLYSVDLDVVVTMTYNGVPMVEQAKIARAPSVNRYVWLFSKYGTSTGTNNMVASFSPNSRSMIGAVTITGADQTDTIDGSQAVNQTSGTTEATTTLSPSVAGCVILATSVTDSDSNGVTGDSNTTQINYFDITQMLRSADVPIASSGSYNIGYTYASGAASIAAGIFAPAAGAPASTFTPKMMMF